MIFLFLFITVLILSIFINVKVYRINISSVAGAPIMSLGIMIISTLNNELYSVTQIKNLLYFVLFISLWVLIQYALDAFQGTFIMFHLKDPISSFSVGTWVAATSVLIVLLSGKEHSSILQILFIINHLIWFLYMFLILRNYRVILKQIKQYGNGIQGGLLLTCVATQSIVISGYSAFGSSFPVSYATILSIIGIFFYLFNASLIWYFHFIRLTTDITESWKNTNCIIHGALSITGVAITMFYSEKQPFIMFLWTLVCFLFILIEMIEVFRGIQRVRKFGWKKGIFVYNPSQWARTFTFGMFLFFTEKANLIAVPFFTFIKNTILSILSIILSVIILIEIILFTTELLSKFIRKDKGINDVPVQSNQSFQG